MLLLFFVTLSLFSQSRFPTYFQAFVVVFEGFFSSSSSRQLGGNGGESVDNLRATIALLEGGPLTQTIREARHSPYTEKVFCKKLRQKRLFYVCKTSKNVWNMRLTTLWIPYLFRVSQFSFLLLLLPREILMTVATLSPSSPLLFLCQDKSSQFLDLWVELCAVLRTWRPTWKRPFPARQDEKKVRNKSRKMKILRENRLCLGKFCINCNVSPFSFKAYFLAKYVFWGVAWLSHRKN